MSIIENREITVNQVELSQNEIDTFFLPHDIQRLEAYCYNQVEYRLIIDLTMDLALLYFESKIISDHMDSLQKAVLLGVGLQNKTIEQLSIEFNMPVNQVLAKFYDCIKKLTRSIISSMESNIEKTITNVSTQKFSSLTESLNDEVKNAVDKINKTHTTELHALKKQDIDQFVIKGNEDEWNKALFQTKSKIVSVKM